LRAEPLANFDRARSALNRVVGIDQKQTVVGQHFGVLFERFHLAVEGHHPTVGVRALHRNLEIGAGQHARGSDAAADIGSATRRVPAVDALRASQAELDHGIALRGVDDAGRLRRDQRLEIDHVK